MWNMTRRRLNPLAVTLLLCAALLIARGGAGRGANEAPPKATPPRATPAAPVAPPAATEVRLTTKRDVAPGPNIRLYLNTRNLAIVSVAVYKVDAEKWLRLRQNHDIETEALRIPDALPPGKPARVFSVTVGDPKLRSSREQPDIYRSKQFNLPALPPDAYLLVASGGGRRTWAVVNVTQLAVVVKRSPNAVLTWVTDHRTGSPVVGATVTIWDKSGDKEIARGRSDKDGVCQIAARSDAGQVLIVTRSTPGQSVDRAGLLVSGVSPDGHLVSHLQTDRPIYRPGATVSYRAILRRTRGNGFAAPVTEPITTEIRDSRDNVFQRTEEKTNAIGTLAGSFPVPARGSLGAYSLVLTAKDGQKAYATFTVAEYRKPDFLASVTPGKERYLSGEPGTFALKASYYFGAPLPGAAVRYLIRSRPTPFYGSLSDDPADSAWFASGDGNLYAHDTYAADAVVGDGTVVTDAAGNATIPFPTKRDMGDAAYTISATVTDGQRREVTTTASVPVYAATLRLGIRAQNQVAPLNAVVPVDLIVSDPDGRPAGSKVTLVTRQQEWDEKKHISEWHVLSQSAAVVPASGKQTTNVPAAKEGDVEVRATIADGTGRIAIATTHFYVAAPDTPSEEEVKEPIVQARLGKPSYQPGETATVFLTTNSPKRPVLLTIEGESLFAVKVMLPGKTRFVWKVPVTLAMSPNVYVTATQWAHVISKASHFSRLIDCTTTLPVPDRSRRLDLSVTPDRAEHGPGDTVIYTIRARDGKSGQPVVGAEVVLAVIDEAIFAVRPDATPDLYATFWGLRGNHTQTNASAPEEVSGGAYQRAAPDGVAPVRQKFLDTAFWNAHLLTGPDGMAVAHVELPGNLTAWRATALGVTRSTAVGRAVSKITASRLVMLRIAAPRQFVQGDQLTLIGTVSNRSERDHTFTVTLNATGVQPAANESATKSVTVKAKGEAKVEWHVSAETIPTTDGRAVLDATLIATDRTPGETLADYSDHLRMAVPVRPRGVATRIQAGVAVPGDTAALTLDLPADRLEPATDLLITVRGGPESSARAAATGLYATGSYGTIAAADRLLVAATPGAPPMKPELLRDALAFLSRSQSPQGDWGWWEDAPADARVTARVLRALRAVKAAPNLLPRDLPFPEALLSRGLRGADALYKESGLPEERAFLAPATEKPAYLAEVAERDAAFLSPAATLALAKGILETGNKERARQLAALVFALAVSGVDSAYIPAGERPGQRSGVIETTALALETLVALGDDAPLQSKLARWLLLPGEGGEDSSDATDSEQADTVRALLLYSRAVSGGSGDATVRSLMPSPGDFSVTVNGVPVPWEARAPGTETTTPLTASVPRSLLKDGTNAITLVRKGTARNAAFLAAEAVVYRPQVGETAGGMRVLRRFETQSMFGVWGEVLPGVTDVLPASAVRVTVVVWPGESADALRVTEPLPSGFEFVDSERMSNVREEVRDGALLHYLSVHGSEPVTFRYYLRAESEGTLIALPATGELIRRPRVRGGSASQVLDVREAARGTSKPVAEKTP